MCFAAADMRRTRLILSAACQRLRLASCLAATVTMRHDLVSCGAAGVEPGAGNLSCQQRYIQQSPQQWSKTPCKNGCSRTHWQGSRDRDTGVPLSIHWQQRCRHILHAELLITRQPCRAPDDCPAAGVMQEPIASVTLGLSMICRRDQRRCYVGSACAHLLALQLA